MFSSQLSFNTKGRTLQMVWKKPMQVHNHLNRVAPKSIKLILEVPRLKQTEMIQYGTLSSMLQLHKLRIQAPHADEHSTIFTAVK